MRVRVPEGSYPWRQLWPHMSVHTIAGGQDPVPRGLSVPSNHTRDGRRVSDLVARVTLVCDSWAELEVGPDPCPIHYVSRVKTGFPWFLCGRNECKLHESRDFISLSVQQRKNAKKKIDWLMTKLLMFKSMIIIEKQKKTPLIKLHFSFFKWQQTAEFLLWLISWLLYFIHSKMKSHHILGRDGRIGFSKGVWLNSCELRVIFFMLGRWSRKEVLILYYPHWIKDAKFSWKTCFLIRKGQALCLECNNYPRQFHSNCSTCCKEVGVDHVSGIELDILHVSFKCSSISVTWGWSGHCFTFWEYEAQDRLNNFHKKFPEKSCPVIGPLKDTFAKNLDV